MLERSGGHRRWCGRAGPPCPAAGAVPGSLGPRRLFAVVFALLALLTAAFLELRPRGRVSQRRHRRGEVTRQITDVQGDTYLYSYSLRTGVALSVLVGFVARLLGVGG